LKEASRIVRPIDTGDIIGLRDRALIGVMVYSFARVSAAVGMETRLLAFFLRPPDARLFGRALFPR